MRKLLAANFNRLSKDKLSWCVLTVVTIASFVSIFNSAHSYEAMLNQGFVKSLDDYYFSQAPMMGAFIALFISTFLGTEYSDGTIRNKLSVGHRRIHVYLSNFIACSIISLIMLTVWLLISSLGFWLIGPLEMSATEFAAHIIAAMGIAVSFTALYTFIGCLSTNKAMTIIYTFIVYLTLVIVASGLWDRLCVPEMNEGTAYINGEFIMLEPTPNPLYLSGMVRTACQCVLELLPSGQALLLSDVALEHPARAIIFSLVFTIGVLALGCSLFRKKDIK